MLNNLTNEQFDSILNSQNKAFNITDMMKDKLLSKNYDPIITQQNNKKLRDDYNKAQESSLTFEIHIVDNLVKGICGINSEKIAISLGQGLNISILCKLLIGG